MNITNRIVDSLPVKFADIVKADVRIQFYFRDEKYQWRDSRFDKTRNEWSNKQFICLDEFINHVCEHLDYSLKSKYEAVADCDFELNVKCPYCGEEIGLLDQDKGYDQDTEFTKIVFGDWNRVNHDVECCHCDREFTLVGVQR